MEKGKSLSSGSGSLKLNDGEILFRENDHSDAMYVIKSGKIVITKTKGMGEVTLAELGPGQMLGEMAFFDNRPRSAGARATGNTEVIRLPFTALHAQFKTFPEWLKAMIKTINGHLRDANLKIKYLDSANSNDADEKIFSPHAITSLLAILTLVASKYGEKKEHGVKISGSLLRDFTIQIFQLPTHKMQKMIETLTSLNFASLNKTEDGQQEVTLFNPDLLSDLVIFYNVWLFKPIDKRVNILEKDLMPMKALIFYGEKTLPQDNGKVRLSLTNIQNDSMRDLKSLVATDSFDHLIAEKIIGDKFMDNDQIFSEFDLELLKRQVKYWEIIYSLLKVH